MSQVMHDPRSGLDFAEIFDGTSRKDVMKQMDVRRTELERLGHMFVSRTSIGRNTTCPCGSGIKYKKCCLLSGASSPPTFAKVA
jgi:uncharacterized protein YchJ